MGKPREYQFWGSATIKGAKFIVTARSDEEAKEKMEAGDFDDCDYSTGELADYKVDLQTLEWVD